jgi:hypothetical protein
MGGNEMTEYRLHSTGLVYTPGFLAWAMAGMLSDSTKMVDIISRGYNLPDKVARDLLSGTIEHWVEGEAVVFVVENDDDQV